MRPPTRPATKWNGGNPVRTSPQAQGAVVLLDTAQGGVNAYEVARRMRQEANCQVVLLVEPAQRRVGEELAKVVQADLITKPLEVSALTRLLAGYSGTGGKPSLDAMIGALEAVVDPEKLATNLLADMEVREGEEGTLIQALTDPETGLFNFPLHGLSPGGGVQAFPPFRTPPEHDPPGDASGRRHRQGGSHPS